MKTAIAFGLGFLLGRQIYMQWDKATAQNKEAEMKDQVKTYLEELGLNPDEIQAEIKKLMSAKATTKSA